MIEVLRREGFSARFDVYFVERKTMNVLLLNAVAASLFMDAEPTAAPAGSGPFQAVLMIFVVLLALFFIFILPAKSRDKQMQKLLDSIKINDRVLTTGGVIGTVYSIDRQAGEVVLRVDDNNNVKVHFAISSVYYVFNKETAEKDKEKDKSKK
ncbi:MAG: preprotein translocase subunit YajC [Thermoguttaceae bacterium]|nr:preprotein translocase subunit YajC [Thermoguttaceae bacterium]